MLSKRLAFQPARPATIGAAYYGFFWPMVAMYAPYFNVYLLELGFSGTQIGILAAVFPLFALVVSPALSALADRRGWRLRLLQISLLGWAVVLLLYRFPTSFSAFLLLVILESAMRSPTLPIADGVIAQMAVRHRLNFGNMRLWGSFGFATFSILSGIAWQQIGYRSMFLAAALAALPALLIARRLEEGSVAVTNGRRSVLFLMQDKGLVILYTTAFLIGMAMFSTFVFSGVFMTQLGGSETQIGLLFGLSALAEVPIMRRSGQIIQRLREPQALLLAIALCGISLLGHAVAGSAIMLIVAGIVKGLGFGLFFVVMVQLLDERAPAGWTSTAQSMFQAAFFGLAPLLTTALSGYIFDVWGAALLFGLMTAVIGLSILLLLLTIQKNWFAPHRWDMPEQ